MAKTAASRQPGPDRILDAALDLAGEMRWRNITMEMIADASGAKLARVYELFPSKAALITAFIRRTDRAVLAGHDFEDVSEPCRERLLDVLMRRFEALRPHRNAVAAISRDIGADPGSMLCTLPAIARAMAWSLEAAGIRASGPLGIIRIKGLSLIYLAAVRVWLRDDTQDLSITMAQIDKNLKRAESLMSALPIAGRARRDRAD
jgi:AcrR family transcriptional regulator